MRHDEAQLIQNTKEAAQQLQELFEADAVGPLSGLPQLQGRAAREAYHRVRDDDQRLYSGKGKIIMLQRNAQRTSPSTIYLRSAGARVLSIRTGR